MITDLNTVQFVNNNLQNAIMSRSSLDNILTIVVIARLPKENQIDKDDVKYEMAHSRIKNVFQRCVRLNTKENFELPGG